MYVLEFGEFNIRLRQYIVSNNILWLKMKITIMKLWNNNIWWRWWRYYFITLQCLDFETTRSMSFVSSLFQPYIKKVNVYTFNQHTGITIRPVIGDFYRRWIGKNPAFQMSQHVQQVCTRWDKAHAVEPENGKQSNWLTGSVNL